MEIDEKKLSLVRASKHIHKPGKKWPVEKRIEAVTQYLAIGNMRIVAELTGVSYGLLRLWRMEDWWEDLEREIKASRKLQVDNKLSKLIDRSLDMIQDRLSNGDFIFNNKTGEVIRKEVSLRDVTTVANTLMQKQIDLTKLQNEEVVQTQQVAVQDQLKLLAAEFAKFNKRNTGPVEDAKVLTHAVHDQRETGLQEGSREIYLEAGSEEEEGSAECSSPGNGESWEGPQGGREGSGPQEGVEQGWDELEEQSESSAGASERFFFSQQ